MTRYQVTQKRYCCKVCGTERLFSTNHWSDIYPYCYHCYRVTTWECLETPPEGHQHLPSWKATTLGSMIHIITA